MREFWPNEPNLDRQIKTWFEEQCGTSGDDGGETASAQMLKREGLGSNRSCTRVTLSSGWPLPKLSVKAPEVTAPEWLHSRCCGMG